MSTDRSKVFGTGIMLAMLLAAFAAFAQDELQDIGAAVDTSGVDLPEAAATSSAADLEPAVDT